MPETVAPQASSAPQVSSMSRPLLVAGAAGVLALLGTVLLWAHYGATVFFETIRAGLAACFG
jgi:hypothetical protein